MSDITDVSSISERLTHNYCSDAEDDLSCKDGNAKFLFSSYRILLKKNLADDATVYNAARSFNVPVCIVDDFNSDDLKDVLTIRVVDSFDGIKQNGANYRILGKTALLELAQKKDTLKDFNRPLYCHAMAGLVVCLTGFKRKEMTTLMKLVRNMGGSVRKEMFEKVTHLIAESVGGGKYYYAMTFRVPIVNDSWVYSAWENKDVLGFKASDPNFISQHKTSVFHGTRVCFLGFPDEEKSHMIEILLENGGISTDLADSTCTHLVLDCKKTYQAVKSMMNHFSSTPITFNTIDIPVPQSIPNDESINTHDLITPCKKLKLSPLVKTFPKAKSDPSVDSYYIWSSFLKQNIYSRRKHDFSAKRKLCNMSDDRSKPIPLYSNNSEENLRAINEIDNHEPQNTVPSSFLNGNILDKNLDVSMQCDQDDEIDSTVLESRNTMPNITYRKEHCGMNFLDSTIMDMDIERTLNTIPEIDVVFNYNDISRFKNSGDRSLDDDSTVVAEDPKLKNSNFDDIMDISKNENHIREQCLNSLISTSFNSFNASSNDLDLYKEIAAASLMVIDESTIKSCPPLNSHHTHIVKANWFWASVQNEGCENENNYKFEDVECTLSPLGLNNSTPLSTSSRARKRKRIRSRSRFPSLSHDLSPSQSAQKRRSSASDATRLSDGSILDYTASPDITDDVVSPIREKSKSSNARYHRFLELCQTESNYVNILNTIMTLFKSALDEMADTEAQLINATELKIIFGNVPPIYYTHNNMLEELKQLANSWNENTSIGNLFLKYSGDLVKAYIPFINFFENSREMLNKCDRTKPRFHAFLKICQTKPECGRESLQDLLIRPVQRLPSINLLLHDILRHTPKSHPDHKALEAAIASMDEVMTRMNEDKRRTEGQVALFDIFNDIDNCPAHLVSSQRCFISKCEVTELSDSLSGRGHPLVFFMFSDVIEVSKKRMKAFNTLKSPKENTQKHTNGKLYKHITLVSLSSIKKVIDIHETDDCHNVFALIVKNTQNSEEKVHSFTIMDENVDKEQYLRSLCKQIATTTCRTDAENFLTSLDGHELDIVSSDISVGTLGRAINKFAAKTKMKVGRAFSFNKTPNKLKRAMSTMMSPRTISAMMSPFGSQNPLTPSAELAGLQLAPLVSNLSSNDMSVSMTAQPLRRNKSSSFTMGSLRRL